MARRSSPRQESTQSPIVPRELDHRIEQREISSLRALGRKARVHSRKELDLISRSIQQFGFVNPILRCCRIRSGYRRWTAPRPYR